MTRFIIIRNTVTPCSNGMSEFSCSIIGDGYNRPEAIVADTSRYVMDVVAQTFIVVRVAVSKRNVVSIARIPGDLVSCEGSRRRSNPRIAMTPACSSSGREYFRRTWN